MKIYPFIIRPWAHGVMAALMLLVSACTSPSVSPSLEPVAETAALASTQTRRAPAQTTASAAPVTQITPSSLNLEATQVRGQIVRFWHPWSDATGEVLEALVEEFNLQNPWRIVVSIVGLAGFDEVNERLQVAFDQVDRPDVVVGYWHQAQYWNEQLPLVDWQPYLDDLQWGWSVADRADLIPAFWSFEHIAGRRLGLPAQRFGAVLFYNRSWAQELGFSAPPRTPEEFRVQACAAARAFRLDDRLENDGLGGWIVQTDYPVLLGWLYAFQADPVLSATDSTQSIYRFNTPQTAEAFTFLKNLYDAGCAWQPETQTMEQAFASRSALFAAGSVAEVPIIAQAFQQQGNLDDWTVIPFPSLDQPAIDIYGPAYFMLPSYPERQLAAWLFVKWLLEPDNQRRLTEAAGGFPLRRSVLEQLSDFQEVFPQWKAAVDLLPFARSEPADRSWSVVRWALSDAGTQLFRSYFRLDQLPNLLDYLDYTAEELVQASRASAAATAPAQGEQPAALTATPAP